MVEQSSLVGVHMGREHLDWQTGVSDSQPTNLEALNRLEMLLSGRKQLPIGLLCIAL